jgi:hypothetical protein
VSHDGARTAPSRSLRHNHASGGGGYNHSTGYERKRNRARLGPRPEAPVGPPVVEVDDHELRLEEFGKLLPTYSGWGMPIEFVPHDEVHRHPAHEVREQEITLWQDRNEMEDGVGWWKQIEEALDQVSFLVIVMTPAAMRSEMT